MNDAVYTVVCNITDHTCELEKIIPARSYMVGLKACFTPVEDKKICSSLNVTQTAWTKPGGNSLLVH